MKDVFKMSELLCEELADCLETNTVLPMIQHPLVHAIYHPATNDCFNRMLAQKKLCRDVALGERKWDTYVFVHERPYRIAALDELYTEIPAEEFWKLFGDVYVDSENLHQSYDIISGWLDDSQSQGIFDYPEYVMTERELAYLADLPDRLKVFRGYAPSEIIPKDWSWTLDKNTASWFANRFNQGGIVRSGWVDKKHVMAYFDRRSESEVLLFPEHVENVK